MMIQILTTFAGLFKRSKVEPKTVSVPVERPRQVTLPAPEIAPNDPIVVYFQSSPGIVELDKLAMDSPALRALQAAGVRVVVPLVSQGELVGLLNLGQHLSEQDYSLDDRILLNNLATQAAPALRVAQLVRQRQAEALALERMEQELRVARLIQQTLLPKQVPELEGWKVAVHYQPQRAVGGDFYDFFPLPDGRLVIIEGDVTDKGVPAALVMATTRAILRGSARRLLSPSAALARTNELLCPEIPPNMFVTCLFSILDPATGKLQYANAGHNLPIRNHRGDVTELRATGMPLGLLPGMQYEEKEAFLDPGDAVLIYSDGLSEAHDPQREMFGFPRMRDVMTQNADSQQLIDSLIKALGSFTGVGWEQEDDVTMLVLERTPAAPTTSPASVPVPAHLERVSNIDHGHRLADFALPSEQGKEYEAMKMVAEVVEELGLPEARIENLKTAVSEATMNAIEHGNEYRADVPVFVRVMASDDKLSVFITDQGGGRAIPAPETPDLEAKLAGLQSPRGWGLFLIKNLVDDLRVTSDDQHHTVELVLNLKGVVHSLDSAPAVE
jgi:serine phosphatase RsbU (regulator of sigma subunit)/anti-sigma regulatory factor (Ser/Thr protein kinase)